jgi:hypothetical protein
MTDSDNDGRFPGDSLVMVRYPRTSVEEHGDRDRWPWLPGSILQQGGPDEWLVCVEVRDLASLDDGYPAPAGTAEEDLVYPACFRDATEIRPRAVTVDGEVR